MALPSIELMGQIPQKQKFLLFQIWFEKNNVLKQYVKQIYPIFSELLYLLKIVPPIHADLQAF